jgi:S-adenosylmethionine:diacylglycerol 3-amino-3-carboxypropyl transferase
MSALIDALLYIVIIGTAVMIISALLYGISHIVHKIHGLNDTEQDKHNRIHSNRKYMRAHITQL